MSRTAGDMVGIRHLTVASHFPNDQSRPLDVRLISCTQQSYESIKSISGPIGIMLVELFNLERYAAVC